MSTRPSPHSLAQAIHISMPFCMSSGVELLIFSMAAAGAW